MGAQGDMDLVVHVKPLGMVVQLFSLQGYSCHEAKSPVEVFKMELLEDSISAFYFIPPHSPQVWQQLVSLLGAQPVCLAGHVQCGKQVAAARERAAGKQQATAGAGQRSGGRG